MKLSYLISIMFLMALNACTKPDNWVPDQTLTLDYFYYAESSPPFCYPQCKYFKYYIFESGYLVYFGGGEVPEKGWRRKQLNPEIYTQVIAILTKHRFDEFAPVYDYQEEKCPDPFAPDLGGFIFTFKHGSDFKKVYWENGCTYSNDHDTIVNLDRSLRQLLPLEKLVGKDHYTWRYSHEYKNIILKDEN